MAQLEHGNRWTVEIDDNVLIWEFLPGMELSAFKEEAYPVFEDVLETHEITSMITHVKLDDPFTADAFEVWEQSAQRASEAGIDRWAVVADGIKALSLRGKINTGDLDTMTTENRAEAVDWASE